MQDSKLVLFIILFTYSLWLLSGEYCYKQLLLVVSLQMERVVLLHLFYTCFIYRFKSWILIDDLNHDLNQLNWSI